jgi:serine/threonine protein kinase/WD40 repeat protein
MTRPPLRRIEELFDQAVDLEPGARAAFLDTACGGDSELRAAVDGLLRHDDGRDKTEAFIVSPIQRLTDDTQPADGQGGFALPCQGPPGYELIEILGRGGMGVVFKARQLSLGRLVALKMLAPAPISAGRLARFRAEADALARLQHPNIVQIYEVGEYESRPFIVMEYIAGPNLAHDLEGRPQPPRAAAELVQVLASAIQAVHDRGLIHRDLKPANILLANLAPEERTSPPNYPPLDSVVHFIPKITDFGLVKRLGADSNQTRAGTVLGTPSYMAPEQARGRPEELGPAIDIYALGTILYELLTGRPPFGGTTSEETIAQLLSDEPISPAQVRPALPRDLVTICLKCLEKEPARRYASAAELAADLCRFLAREPIKARPIGLPGRFWRWCRRRPLVAALTATSSLLAVTLVVTIISYESSLLDQTRHQLHGAEEEAAQNRDLAEDGRRQLSKLDRNLGSLELERGDAIAALLWLIEALRRDSSDRDHEREDRIAIALALQNCPRLLQFQLLGRQVVGLQASGSGCWAATLGEDRTLKIWDVMTGQVRLLGGAVPETWLRGETELHQTAISPDGRLVAVAAPDGSIRLWDLNTGQPQRQPLPIGAPVRRIIFSEHNGLLIAQPANGRLQVWEVRKGQRIPLEGTEGESVTLSDNGRWLFALSRDGLGSARQLPGSNLMTGPVRLTRSPALSALSADGRRLALMDAANALWVWDLATAKERLLIPQVGSEGFVRQMQWSPDGRLILTVGDRARVWEAETGTLAASSLGYGASLWWVGFAGNNRVFAVGKNGSARLWQLASAREEAAGSDQQLAPAEPARPDAVPNSIQLADGQTVRVKRPLTHAPLQPPRPQEKIVEQAAFSHDGRRVATVGEDQAVHVWDSTTGTQLIAPLPHREMVFYAAFSPDGRHLVTASVDKTVTVWDIKTGEPIGSLPKTSRELERVAFRSDGRQVILFLKGGFLSRWDLAPETRPLEDLHSLALILSGYRVGEQGKLVPLEAEQLESVRNKTPLFKSLSQD